MYIGGRVSGEKCCLMFVRYSRYGVSKWRDDVLEVLEASVDAYYPRYYVDTYFCAAK